MLDMIDNDYKLDQYCEAMAHDIADAYSDEWEEREDAVYQWVDSCEYVIKSRLALQICSECSTDYGDDYLRDHWIPENTTLKEIATIVAYGEILARVQQALFQIEEGELS